MVCPARSDRKAASGNLDAWALPYGYRHEPQAPESTRIEPIAAGARSLWDHRPGSRDAPNASCVRKPRPAGRRRVSTPCSRKTPGRGRTEYRPEFVREVRLVAISGPMRCHRQVASRDDVTNSHSHSTPRQIWRRRTGLRSLAITCPSRPSASSREEAQKATAGSRTAISSISSRRSRLRFGRAHRTIGCPSEVMTLSPRGIRLQRPTSAAHEHGCRRCPTSRSTCRSQRVP